MPYPFHTDTNLIKKSGFPPLKNLQQAHNSVTPSPVSLLPTLLNFWPRCGLVSAFGHCCTSRAFQKVAQPLKHPHHLPTVRLPSYIHFPCGSSPMFSQFQWGKRGFMCKPIVFIQKGDEDQHQVSQADDPQHSNTCWSLLVLRRL